MPGVFWRDRPLAVGTAGPAGPAVPAWPGGNVPCPSGFTVSSRVGPARRKSPQVDSESRLGPVGRPVRRRAERGAGRRFSGALAWSSGNLSCPNGGTCSPNAQPRRGRREETPPREKDLPALVQQGGCAACAAARRAPQIDSESRLGRPGRRRAERGAGRLGRPKTANLNRLSASPPAGIPPLLIKWCTDSRKRQKSLPFCLLHEIICGVTIRPARRFHPPAHPSEPLSDERPPVHPLFLGLRSLRRSVACEFGSLLVKKNTAIHPNPFQAPPPRSSSPLSTRRSPSSLPYRLP